jgi:hypothetical protein
MIAKITIGIDPGRNTGYAVYNHGERNLSTLETLKIHQAFERILYLNETCSVDVVIENPNLWTYFKDSKEARAKLQGAGSIKRDYSAWIDFLEDYSIPYKSVRPDKTRNKLATDINLFQKITGYKEKCSQHARVAAMLVWK